MNKLPEALMRKAREAALDAEFVYDFVQGAVWMYERARGLERVLEVMTYGPYNAQVVGEAREALAKWRLK